MNNYYEKQLIVAPSISRIECTLGYNFIAVTLPHAGHMAEISIISHRLSLNLKSKSGFGPTSQVTFSKSSKIIVSGLRAWEIESHPRPSVPTCVAVGREAAEHFSDFPL